MSPTDGTETRGEWLFRHLLTLYGSRFLAMWRGVDTDDLKRAWSHRLHGLSPEALRAGLEALDGVPHPPTLPEFLALCREERLQRAAIGTPRLPFPVVPAAPEVVEANLKRIHEIVESVRRCKPSPQWAFDMMHRGCAKNGAPLTHETRRISIDAIVSPAGRAFFANGSAEQQAKYRDVFAAALRARGEELPSREPGEDDEPVDSEADNDRV